MAAGTPGPGLNGADASLLRSVAHQVRQEVLPRREHLRLAKLVADRLPGTHAHVAEALRKAADAFYEIQLAPFDTFADALEQQARTIK